MRRGLSVSSLLQPLYGAVLLAFMASSAEASTIDITAEYRNSDTNEEFRNTTPQSGYCVQYYCPEGMFSVDLHVEYDREVKSGLPPLPDRWSIQVPAQRTVTVTSAAGDSANLQLQFTLIAQELRGYTPRLDDNPVNHSQAGGGCTYLQGEFMDGGINQGSYAWDVNNPGNPGLCYPANAGTDDIHPVTITAAYTSVGYKLILPKPYTMASGIYHGTVTLSVGESGDFALGSKVRNLSHNTMTLNFTLTVHHELSLQFPANSERVVLEPPAGGWQRWLDTGAVPKQLQAELPYRITVSGPFRLIMHCGESGSPPGSCIIRNKRTRAESLFWTKVSFPRSFGISPFYIGDGQRVRVTTPRYVRNEVGKFNFEVYSPYIEPLLASPGDDWEGLVTLVFDASI